jgi:hypothetical protein
MWSQSAIGNEEAPKTLERIVEWTVESRKIYKDPFNEVDIDAVFSRDGKSWRVPMFWRGGQRWTVRFAPPTPGEYKYRLESTDKTNPDLNGHAGRVNIIAYTGNNSVLKRGMLLVSANKRYFQHADGTPFYWLGDTWWTGLSDRLPFRGFQELVLDRKEKGFTVVQIVAGLIPPEEICPIDPGCRNEGGAVWDAEFKQINPEFFDYADRRIEYLLEEGIVPAIVGAWYERLNQMGAAKIKKHWRYIIARYGAYPVFWIAGGEIFDPTEEVARLSGWMFRLNNIGSWNDIVRYVRATDPYHHPVTVHEWMIDELPLQDESLTDFHLLQFSHSGWSSIAVEVAKLNIHYSRTEVTKPLVVGEIGYEHLFKLHHEDFQRTAFWLGMLNGAAGHTYGADGTWESYSADKPLHRLKWSFITWEEGMRLPGSYQIGLGAKLLRQYPWWQFAPHPEWVTPRGTTLLQPRGGKNRFHVDLRAELPDQAATLEGTHVDASEWSARSGNFRLPYAAGIPREIRFIYVPNLINAPAENPPTISGLELGVRYHAYYWEPSSGMKVDLGTVERPMPGGLIYDSRSAQTHKDLRALGRKLAVVDGVDEANLVATVEIPSDADVSLLLRVKNMDNFLAATYSGKERALYLMEHKQGVSGPPLGRVSVSADEGIFRLSAEARKEKAIASIEIAGKTISTPIVTIANTGAGSAGLMHDGDADLQNFVDFELRHSPALTADEHLERRLYDANGKFRGELSGSGMHLHGSDIAGWDDYAKDKHILLDSYLPENLPTLGDWVLVLDANSSRLGE